MTSAKICDVRGCADIFLGAVTLLIATDRFSLINLTWKSNPERLRVANDADKAASHHTGTGIRLRREDSINRFAPFRSFRRPVTSETPPLDLKSAYRTKIGGNGNSNIVVVANFPIVIVPVTLNPNSLGKRALSGPPGMVNAYTTNFDPSAMINPGSVAFV